VFLSDATATREMNGVPASDPQRATPVTLGMVFAQISTVHDVRSKLGVSATPAVATVTH
jgi:hypothetical protein